MKRGYVLIIMPILICFLATYSLSKQEHDPAGFRIAFTSNRSAADGRPHLWAINSDKSGLSQLTNFADPWTVFYPISSPDGNWIAFQKEDQPSKCRSEIWKIRPNGTDLLLVNDPGPQNYNHSSPMNWSPDGSVILFTSEQSNNNGWYLLWRINADGTSAAILDDNGNAPLGAFAPSGLEIVSANSWDYNRPSDIKKMNADGSNKMMLVYASHWPSSFGPLGNLVWTPQNKIIFSIGDYAANTHDISIMNSDGTGLTTLEGSAGDDTFGQYQREGQKAVSSDGSKLIFHSNKGGNYDIYIVNTDGTGQNRLTEDPGEDKWAAFSPDGTQIVWVSNSSGKYALWMMDLDGKDKIQITDDEGDVLGFALTSKISFDQPPAVPASISYPAASSTGRYVVAWEISGRTTSYQVERSSDGGETWSPVYSGAAAFFSESVGNGSYRYRVRASNDAGASDWRAGTPDCSVILLVPKIGLNRDTFSFAATRGGLSSPSRQLLINNSGEGILNWTAVKSADWMTIGPESRTGSGVLTIAIAQTDLIPGLYQGTVTISDPFASNSPQVVTIDYQVYESGSTSLPFGSFDSPTEGKAVASSIPVTGWALDDIGLQSVKIYRGTGMNDRAFIGDAVFVEGARPDVEAAYPGYPMNDKAGWGYMMLTNFLPLGDGPYSLLAYGTDLEGHEVLLGQKSITVNNAAAILPFGAIDSPAQGGTASGNLYYNFGWVLTPQPNSIPLDGSTIHVWVDGAALGHPNYGYNREDIATQFTAFKNADKAVGVYNLDTTTFTTAVHTIAWSAVDSAGHVDGIGSRYFSIQNISGSPSPAAPAGKTLRTIEDLAGMAEDRWTPVFVRRGTVLDAPVEMVVPDGDGISRISVFEITRIALYLEKEISDEREEAMIQRGARILHKVPSSAVRYEAYALANGRLRNLPIGASFDNVDGVFYWQPGPGFLGEYQIIIVDTELKTIRTIRIKIVSK